MRALGWKMDNDVRYSRGEMKRLTGDVEDDGRSHAPVDMICVEEYERSAQEQMR